MTLRPTLAVYFLMAAALLSCGKQPAGTPAAGSAGSAAAPATPSGPPDPRSAAIIAKSKELRDRACACADAACATAVRTDHDRWLRAQIDEMAKLGEPRSTPAEQAEAGKFQRELFACLEMPAKSPVPAPTP